MKSYLTYALWNKVALSINTQKPFSLPSQDTHVTIVAL